MIFAMTMACTLQEMLGAVTKLTVNDCELCKSDGGQLVWHDDFCRVVLIEDLDYPGFCRVILNNHVSEMTALNPTDRDRLMRVVFATEAALLEMMSPLKINLASLGNMVPHIHWHVIPRFSDDRHFPAPIWGAPRRQHSGTVEKPDIRALASRLKKMAG